MESKPHTSTLAQTATHVSIVSIVVNIALSLMKLFAGIVAHSGAMISDAIHSASDVFSTIIVIVGVRISSKKEDKEHPYGHDRMECVASLILAGLLAVTGFLIGKSGVQTIASGKAIAVPGVLALVAAVVSIAVKEWMYHYTIRAAKRVNSGALKADAWHHRSDALSSVGALIGIAGARLGLPILDPLAEIIIALMVIKVGFDIGKDSINKMVDRSVDEKTLAAILRVAEHHPGVVRVDDLRSRTFGSNFYIDLEIAVDHTLDIQRAHAIAETLHNVLEERYPNLKHCMIHVNPDVDLSDAAKAELQQQAEAQDGVKKS
ncbi:MAG: cation diffusion facilitator family transporter [Pseudoramibacter sp.]|jgi:cation diffusion facilitator family transporter